VANHPHFLAVFQLPPHIELAGHRLNAVGEEQPGETLRLVRIPDDRSPRRRFPTTQDNKASRIADVFTE
jgi:hypothetical protein